MASEKPATKKKVVTKKKTAKKVAAKKKVVAKKKVATRKKVVANQEAVTNKKPVSVGANDQPTAGNSPVITLDERYELICKAAHTISTKRTPCSGDMESDWVYAEAVIDSIFQVKI